MTTQLRVGVRSEVGAADATQPSVRFAVLDGLRGLAAVAVVAYHANSHIGLPFLSSSGYLAVDFFFALSGFVLAYAYESRLIDHRLSVKGFVARRIVRLWPLGVLGTLIGLTTVTLAPAAMDFVVARDSPLFPVVVVTSLLLLPNELPSVGPLYPLNPPFWSLLYEVVVNFAYAVLAPRLTRRFLTSLLIVTGVAAAGTTALHGTSEYLGVTRAAYPFFAGVAIHRAWKSGVRLPRIPPALLNVALIGAMFTPAPTALLHALRDMLFVLVLFPVLVWAGASAETGAVHRHWSLVAGEASYPLYAIHFPLVMLLIPAFDRVDSHAAKGTLLVFVICGLAMLALAASRGWDRPLRRQLNRALSLRGNGSARVVT